MLSLHCFNTASGMAQLQPMLIRLLFALAIRFNTASGMAQLQLTNAKSSNRAGQPCFNTASGMAQLQQIIRKIRMTATCFNTASGMAQLQLYREENNYGYQWFQYRKRYGPVATLTSSHSAHHLRGVFQYRKRYGPVAT